MAKAASFAEPVIMPIHRDRPMLGAALSIALHVAVVGAFYVTWPYLKQESHETLPMVVDLVPVSEITAAPPKPTPKVDEEQPKPEQEKPKEEAAPKQEEPPPPEPKKAEPPPPAPKPEPTPPPPPPPKVPPPPPKPQPPKKKDDMAAIADYLKDLKKMQPPKPQQQNPTISNAPNVQATAQSDRATMTELDAIRTHIEGCWRFDPGKEGIENLSADIRVFINPDGSVRDANIVDQGRLLVDGTFRSFANNARLSVKGCTGIPITPQHYEQLKDMTLHFSPQGMIN